MKPNLILLALIASLAAHGQVFNETINLNVRSTYGGDYPTDNSYYTNVLAIGGASAAETGLKIYKQDPGNSPSFIGPQSYHDAYVFEMTDGNGSYPDGGIIFGGTGNNDIFKSYMTIRGNGKVGIGTVNPSVSLEVAGHIRSTEIKVESQWWPDYVFQEDYKLQSLSDTEAFVNKNKHLPGIPSAEEVEEKGIVAL